MALGIIRIRPRDVVEYGEESVKYTVLSLFSFPPDPFPLITLIAVIFITATAISKVAQGKGLRVREWVLVIGIWGGHHAMKENRVRKELKKTVEAFSAELNHAEEQLLRWKQVIEDEERKIETMRDASGLLQKTSSQLKRALAIFKEQLDLQKGLCGEYLKLVLKMDEGSLLTQGTIKQQQVNAEKISQMIARQIQELKEARGEQLRMIKLQKEGEARLIFQIERWREMRREKADVE